MTDVMTPEQRHRCMSRIRGKNTRPELMLRKILWSQGLRYKIQNNLPGRPDILFPRQRLAIFVDGCFWHGCPKHGVTPATNRGFWSAKLYKNMKRDQEVDSLLQEMGWTVLRFWEHEITDDIGYVLSSIQAAL